MSRVVAAWKPLQLTMVIWARRRDVQDRGAAKYLTVG
jgi:hypothetical protein